MTVYPPMTDLTRSGVPFELREMALEYATAQAHATGTPQFVAYRRIVSDLPARCWKRRWVVRPRPRTVPLIGGPYDGVRVGPGLPDLILVGRRDVPYHLIRHPDTGKSLDGYAYTPNATLPGAILHLGVDL